MSWPTMEGRGGEGRGFLSPPHCSPEVFERRFPLLALCFTPGSISQCRGGHHHTVESAKAPKDRAEDRTQHLPGTGRGGGGACSLWLFIHTNTHRVRGPPCQRKFLSKFLSRANWNTEARFTQPATHISITGPSSYRLNTNHLQGKLRLCWAHSWTMNTHPNLF